MTGGTQNLSILVDGTSKKKFENPWSRIFFKLLPNNIIMCFKTKFKFRRLNSNPYTIFCKNYFWMLSNPSQKSNLSNTETEVLQF